MIYFSVLVKNPAILLRLGAISRTLIERYNTTNKDKKNGLKNPKNTRGGIGNKSYQPPRTFYTFIQSQIYPTGQGLFFSINFVQ